MALARYSAAIQNSIQRAFLGTDVQDIIDSSQPLSAPPQAQPPANQQPETIHMLEAPAEAAPTPADAGPVQFVPPPPGAVPIQDMEQPPQIDGIEVPVPAWEQRREQMRQQFLSALNHID
jgi:hypothetical protein